MLLLGMRSSTLSVGLSLTPAANRTGDGLEGTLVGQRTCIMGESITVHLVPSLTNTDSLSSEHTNNDIFYCLVNTDKFETP